MKPKEMSKLPETIKQLVNEGVYSVYPMRSSNEKVLVTDQGQYFLLSFEGEISKKIASLSGLQLGESIQFPDVSNPSSVKANII